MINGYDWLLIKLDSGRLKLIRPNDWWIKDYNEKGHHGLHYFRNKLNSIFLLYSRQIVAKGSKNVLSELRENYYLDNPHISQPFFHLFST
jgi:hypothetical protein